jgi:Sec-independent protein translocase protein TatA
MLNFLKNISPVEIIILASILVLLFGSKAFIRLGKTFGESLKEIKGIKKSVTDAFEEDEKDSKK